MIRTVNCRKYKKELPGLEQPPYPGSKGQEIFENISKQAWEEWLDHQKMLINESQINLTDRESRKWLNKQMDLFLSGEDYARPKGYTPLKE
jgi:Fe-S cluster biosynthesis and repair protein YggX|tara:strand:- start:85 stop:357 length:273 start_codon:yes stop_codon:yes gene_type:complete